MANAVTTMTAVLQMNNTKFKKGIAGSKQQLTGFQKQINAMKGMIAGAFAIGAVTAFAKSSFQALDTQRKAEASLLTALKGREDIQRSLIQQARELQKTTLFGDEETIQAQALIAAFTKEEATIKRLTPLVQDFATAKQMSLASAADLVSKTIGSSTNALSRYGIAVEGNVGSTERLDSLVRGLENAFLGQAEAAAKADTSLTQLKNAFGDFKETMAAAIIPTGAVKDYIQALSSDDIKWWEKWASVFSPQKAAEIAAIADAIGEVQAGTPGGATGFFESNPTQGQVTPVSILPGIKKVTDAIEDIKLGDVFSGLFSPDTNWYDDLVKRREEMEYFKEILRNTAEVATQELAPALETTSESGDMFKGIVKGIGDSIKQELVNNIYALGEAIGETFAGMEGSLKSLAQTILANIGYILMMAGLQMMAINPAVGIGLLVAGGAIQLGGGIWRGLGRGANSTNLDLTNSNGQVNFKISGQNLVGVLDRQTSKTGRYT